MENETVPITLNCNGTFWRNAKTFKTHLGIRVFSEIINGNTYPILPYFGEVRTIVDIGANVGAASLYFAMNYPNARIVGFEPNPAVYRLLAENIAGLPNVSAHNIGLSDSNGTASLFLGARDSVTGSIHRSPEATDVSVPVTIRNAGEVLAEEGITAIDILKLDTEGCEIPCLRSLSHLIPMISVLFIEYHDEQDRLLLDQMLSETHVLCRSSATTPHRGEVCYVSKSRLPNDGLRIQN